MDSVDASQIPGLKLSKNVDITEVYDRLRKKWLVLTPEEGVRQYFTSWLIDSKKYPASLMGNEISLRLNGMLRRCDTLIYDNSLKPIAVVEYKAPDVAISQNVFDQIARYNMVLSARVLIVTNGISHYCCRYSAGGYEFLKEIPEYRDI